MERIYVVEMTKFAEKQIIKLPHYIKEALSIWKDTIEVLGIQEMRKSPGYHDEPLKGARLGERSSRLSRSYRVIYTVNDRNEIVVISVKEVNKHEY